MPPIYADLENGLLLLYHVLPTLYYMIFGLGLVSPVGQ